MVCATHYCDIIMGTMTSQITSLTIVYSTVYSDADQRKHEGFASLAFVRGIHRGPVNSPRKWPVTRKMFPFDDVIMSRHQFQMYAMLKLSFAVWTVILSEIGLKVIFSSHKSIVRIFYANRGLYVTNGSPWGQLLVTISVSFIFVLQGL